ncbi:hypothetical protein HN011_007060 [Eciton burchellii]|nr:hypothetical protein HN011_007060 [Eciton burchellii]
MRIGVEASHIGRRFPTLRQYGQVPPVILRLFAPRRIVPLYICYICRRRAVSACGMRRDRWSKKKETPRCSGRRAPFSRSSVSAESFSLNLRHLAGKLIENRQIGAPSAQRSKSISV